MFRTSLVTSAAMMMIVGTAQATGPEAPAPQNATRVIVNIENLAPQQGTFQTPFWVGFHEGQFDLYDGNTPASNDPQPGSVGMERLCEDGNNAPLTEDFAELSNGVDATIPGPNGPIAPGDTATRSFILDGSDPALAYFSYASMIIPSNDFCIANGNPLAHRAFDDDGNFVGESFFVVGSETLDAGTEVNDEIPANTAFFGQSTPDTGVDENGLIGTIGSDLPSIGFLPVGSGGVLDDPRFAMSDFLAPGYPFVKISFQSAPAVTEDFNFSAFLSGDNEVPAVRTRAYGFSAAKLREEGTLLRVTSVYSRLRNVVAAHLHLGAPGENGPVVALLLPEDLETLSRRAQRLLRFRINSEIRTGDLLGPLAGQPLDALAAAIEAGNVYVNIHTEANPDGEIRGQLDLY